MLVLGACNRITYSKQMLRQCDGTKDSHTLLSTTHMITFRMGRPVQKAFYYLIIIPKTHLCSKYTYGLNTEYFFQ
jgi:hypothetical protein